MADGILFIPGMWHGAWCYEEHFVPWFREAGLVDQVWISYAVLGAWTVAGCGVTGWVVGRRD